jgi:hypothetical protein
MQLQNKSGMQLYNAALIVPASHSLPEVLGCSTKRHATLDGADYLKKKL